MSIYVLFIPVPINLCIFNLSIHLLYTPYTMQYINPLLHPSRVAGYVMADNNASLLRRPRLPTIRPVPPSSPPPLSYTSELEYMNPMYESQSPYNHPVYQSRTGSHTKSGCYTMATIYYDIGEGAS